jgi:hypothetical protein
MIFRLTQKLNAKIKAGSLAEFPLSDAPFADWSASLFVAGRVQFILVTNTKSLYSMVMFAKGITGDGVFIERALSGLREFMEADGQENAFRRLVAPSASSVQFAKALNRSVTGSMNDQVKLATYMLATGDFSTFDVAFRLNKTPMSALGFEKPLFGMPRNAFKAMVEGSES